jgi:hypothetical protein
LNVHREDVNPLRPAGDDRGTDRPADDIELLTIDDVDVEGRRVLVRVGRAG